MISFFFSTADDSIGPIDVSTSTNKTLNGISLIPGRKYFITVEAENGVEMRTSHSSDGFVVDNTNPIPGVVYNTDRYHNILWYSSSDISASWSGFVDIHSYVKEYHVALAKNDLTNTLVTNGFENVEFFNTHLFTNIIFEQGEKYVVLVKAIDSAGLESDVVSSLPFGVDTTPPTAFRCDSEITVASGYTKINGSFTWTQNVSFIKGGFYKLSLNTVGLSESGKVTFHLGTSFHSLPLIRSYDGNYSSEFSFESPYSGVHPISVAGVHIISKSSDGNATIAISQCISKQVTTDGAVAITQTSRNQIAVDIKVHDEESGIKNIQVGVGTTRKGFQVRPLQKATSMYKVLVDVDLPHASPLYATVVAENHAGLRQDFSTAGVFVLDHTPPKITNLTTALSYNTVPGGKTLVMVHATWNVGEEESAVELCSCSFGKNTFWITDEVLISEMNIWSIIQSDFKTIY